MTTRRPISDKTKARVRKELDRGRLWRAREILQVNVHGHAYEPEMVEQLGKICLEMQDLLAAGRYLFLADANTPEYEKAIQVFLDRHGKHAVHHMPRPLRLKRVRDYPQTVQDRMASVGITDKELRPARKDSFPSPDDPAPVRWTANVIITLIVAYVVLSLVFGMVALPMKVWESIFG